MKYFYVLIEDNLGGEERFFKTENPADFEHNLRQRLLEEINYTIADMENSKDQFGDNWTIDPNDNWEEI